VLAFENWQPAIPLVGKSTFNIEAPLTSTSTFRRERNNKTMLQPLYLILNSFFTIGSTDRDILTKCPTTGIRPAANRMAENIY
jgi:hypothetical protein